MTTTKELYQMTQKEQLAAARAAYMVTLDSDEDATHFSVYLDIEGYDELKCLWPHQIDEWQLLSYQVYCDVDGQFPAFHFEVDCLGMSREAELARTLRQVNPNLKVLWLNGGIPSSF